MHQPFNCFIQGNGTLLIHCAEFLLGNGHAVEGVITTHDAVRRWAGDRSIASFEPGTGATSALIATPFDFFFSIANLALVPPEILALPRRAAINFHDGPLPERAGVYTTTWSILRQEPTHGVTWHLMEAAADTGDILKKQVFPIDPAETAFTLNARCYEHGAASFAELVGELATNRIQRQPQDLSRQTYFGRFQRPEAVGLLNWNRPVAQLHAQVRSLDFGPYENPLTQPKIAVGGNVYAVGAATPVPTRTPKDPGTIIALNDTSITIATADGALILQELTDLQGGPMAVDDLVVLHGLRPGVSIDTITAGDRERLSHLSEELARHESAWLKHMQNLVTINLPYGGHAPDDPPGYHAVDLPLPTPLVQSLSSEPRGNTLVASVAAFLARLTGSFVFDVGYSAVPIRMDLAGLTTFFATSVPLRVTFDKEDRWSTVQKRTEAALAAARRRRTFARDMIGRFPALRALAQEGSLKYGAISIVLTDEVGNYIPEPDCRLALVLGERGGRLVYDAAHFTQTEILALRSQFEAFINDLVVGELPLGDCSLLSPADRRTILETWNDTAAPYPRDRCLHHLVEAQVARTPDAVAISFENQDITFGELNRRANRLGRLLLRRGIGPDQKVAVALDRSPDMMVALLGVLKAGAAYVPLDPTYPRDRLAFMIADAGVTLLLTHSAVRTPLPIDTTPVFYLDQEATALSEQLDSNPTSGVQPHHLSYVIYTSGSTGKPKGVMVEHRNVVNFFAGMDNCLPHDLPGAWLAVTSISFDISVLELFWPLTHGFKVVLYAKTDLTTPSPAVHRSQRPVDFSLFYFASYEGDDVQDKYRMLLEGARFADQHDFKAVWTPERHFGAFGGLYPNPAVTGAAIAAITKRLHIRAGSCVAPLHHPIRIAEEWALVDNLSQGRVGISFAAGWQPNDFVLKPETFADRKAQMFRDIDTIHRLWRGETVTFDGPNGTVPVRTLPRPIQKELPTWITIAGNPETFRMAGAAGFHVLTHLLGQSFEQLAQKLEIYHGAWRAAGHTGRGHVTLMLHTFIGDKVNAVREIVREPMIGYLRSALNLTEQAAWSFPTFKERAASTGMSLQQMFESQALTPEEELAILDHAFERYFETSSLFGDIKRGIAVVDRARATGVDEIACLIDFGVPVDAVLDNLKHLDELRRACAPRQPEAPGATDNFSIPALIRRHGVTHMQCTPSMANMLIMDEETTAALGQLDVLLIGGESFPAALANRLRDVVPGKLLNMYGPTETTIWSTAYEVSVPPTRVPIGRPIANTAIYILDQRRKPVPVGMVGELYIGGDGVVRGYWNRSEMTADRFVQDPFRPGKRMYRTGDLARYLPDGNIEFLGRDDFQVKIRGYRIELGEIETLLDNHPSVQKSVVIAREDAFGDKRLIAYLTAAIGHLDEGDLRQYLREHLPDFMLPAYFVELPSLPLTPNKKVDRKALPDPDKAPTRPRRVPIVLPTNELEQQIAAIWQELLGITAVGVNDNFFDVGGHSILAVQVHRRIRELTRKELTITDLFRFTTIRSLANFLAHDDVNVAPAEVGLEKSLSRAERRRQRFNRRS